MKYLVLLFLIFGITHSASAQRVKHFSDADHIKSYVVRASDTIIIDQDSVMMMNRKTFMIYEMLRKNNSSYKELSDAYDSLLRSRVALYEAQIQKQTEDYNRLHGLMDSLSAHSIDFANTTNKSLKGIADSLAMATRILNDARSGLVKTEKELKKERVRKVLGRFYWGIGGAGIGATAAALAFLFSHK